MRGHKSSSLTRPATRVSAQREAEGLLGALNTVGNILGNLVTLDDEPPPPTWSLWLGEVFSTGLSEALIAGGIVLRNRRFRPRIGRRQPTEARRDTVNLTTACFKCKTMLPASMKFCPDCGDKVAALKAS
jgi:hypothetical protein